MTDRPTAPARIAGVAGAIPQRPCLVVGDEVLTFGEVDRLSAIAAGDHGDEGAIDLDRLAGQQGAYGSHVRGDFLPPRR